MWSEGNQAAGSTKEMNEGHRHDILDEFHGYWNWTKTHRLGTFLIILCGYYQSLASLASAQYSAYTKCLDILKKRMIDFQDFEARMRPQDIQKWKSMDDTPRMENKKVVSVHVAKFKKGANFELCAVNCICKTKWLITGPPSQDKAYKTLLEKEVENEFSGKGHIGDAHFINVGLRLERDQYMTIATPV